MLGRSFSQQRAYFCKSRCEKAEGAQKPIPAAECSFTRIGVSISLLALRCASSPGSGLGGNSASSLRLSVQLRSDDLGEDGERLVDERIDGGIIDVGTAALAQHRSAVRPSD